MILSPPRQLFLGSMRCLASRLAGQASLQCAARPLPRWPGVSACNVHRTFSSSSRLPDTYDAAVVDRKWKAIASDTGVRSMAAVATDTAVPAVFSPLRTLLWFLSAQGCSCGAIVAEIKPPEL